MREQGNTDDALPEDCPFGVKKFDRARLGITQIRTRRFPRNRCGRRSRKEPHIGDANPTRSTDGHQPSITQRGPAYHTSIGEISCVSQRLVRKSDHKSTLVPKDSRCELERKGRRFGLGRRGRRPTRLVLVRLGQQPLQPQFMNDRDYPSEPVPLSHREFLLLRLLFIRRARCSYNAVDEWRPVKRAGGRLRCHVT